MGGSILRLTNIMIHPYSALPSWESVSTLYKPLEDRNKWDFFLLCPLSFHFFLTLFFIHTWDPFRQNMQLPAKLHEGKKYTDSKKPKLLSHQETCLFRMERVDVGCGPAVGCLAPAEIAPSPGLRCSHMQAVPVKQLKN